jgi:hypothetical protein
MKPQVQKWISVTVFVILTTYVGYSALRLGLLLWQRFS